MATRFDVVLVEVALHGLGHSGCLDSPEDQLNGVVSVIGDRLDLRDNARPGLDDRHRYGPGVLEDLGHAQLLSEDAFHVCHSLISISTPAERFRRWSSWTVLEVASTMSINRLWVSIWKCSRESLYLCGERMTV